VAKSNDMIEKDTINDDIVDGSIEKEMETDAEMAGTSARESRFEGRGGREDLSKNLLNLTEPPKL